MRIKIGYEMLVFVGLSKEQILDVENGAGSSIVLTDVSMGLSAKGSKADMFDLICQLAYKYDLEIE